MIKTTIFLLLFLYASAFAQPTKNVTNPLENFDKINSSAGNTLLNDMTQKDLYPVGNVIHPAVYYIGPNDVLSIQILPIESLATPTIVTAENSIVSLRLGEININNLTLQQVRDTLNFIAKSKIPNANVSVSLAKPRTVIVSIRGNVIAPGTYTLPASYSVSTAIKIANQVQSNATVGSQEEQSAIVRLQESQKERERTFSEAGVAVNSNYFSRNIRVRRASGAAFVADIERAAATKNPIYDPFVSENDEIFVPFDVKEYPAISIVGEVLRPISVAYKKGDMASHLLKMGYGFTDNADMNSIYLHDAAVGKIKLDADSAATLLSGDVVLSPGSVIIVGVQKNSNYNNIWTVAVKGEVNSPGVYPIKAGVTRLRDVVEQAGGFTPKAYLARSYIGRRDEQQNERVAPKRLYTEYFQFSDLTTFDTTRFMMDMDLKSPVVSCDMEAAFNDSSESDNVLLQDGDVVFISNNVNKVVVFGQVVNPGFVDYVPGKSMEWYIEQAGGYATGAAKKRARIIRSNRVWENGFADEVTVKDGDEIYVPRPQDIPQAMTLQKWAAIAGLAMTSLTFIQFIYNAFIKK